MPLHLGQGAEDVDDDDKALFVHPDPPLTHTFHLEITPPSFAPTSAPTATDDGSPNPPASVTSSPPASPMTPVEFIPEISSVPTHSRPHGKRRDPSYIPRPPNAFILFRSAFIRDQNIPGKVEGNHSKLSKIIGICWKQLPVEEKEKWEARAVDAQVEHRTRYPDWRFRPGANARLKAGESSTSTTRRRSVRGRTRGSPSKDVSEGESEWKTKDKGKSKSKTTRLPSIEETRCAKIASFVAEGLKGEELEVAVRQWEDDRRITRPEVRPKKSRTSKSRATSLKELPGSQSIKSLTSSFPSSSPAESHADSVASNGSTSTHTQVARTPNIDNSKPSTSTNSSSDDNSASLPLSTVPLTHMFKRRPSVSVSEKRLSSLSDRSDESSLEDGSRTSDDSRPKIWETIVPEKVSKRTHTDLRIDEGSLLMPSTSSTPTFSPPHLAWHGENQHRVEEDQTSNPWWGRRSTPVESRSEFNFDKRDGSGSMVFTTENMGYETHASESQYNRSFAEQYRSYEAPQDGSQHIPWTNFSAAGMGRQGLGIIVEDPYKDDCEDNSPRTISEPSTLSIAPPPSSSSSFYYSSRPTQSPFPSSSYSALSGWAGDYRSHPLHEANIKSWADHTLANVSPSPPAITGPSAWYNDQGVYNWSAARSHAPLSVDSNDWDRHEERAASHMNLVESPRRLDFPDQLHGGS